MKFSLLLTLIFACNILLSQEEKLEVEGAIQISNNDDPTPDPGTIRWNGCDFEGWNGTQWLSLTGSTSNIYGSVTDIDGNDYQTVMIGSQEWMTENLKTTKLNDGTAIPYLQSDSSWDATSTAAYCFPNGDSSLDQNYGKLYNHYTVETDKLCPTGWRVPSSDDFSILSSNASGGALKETGFVYFISPNTAATNCSGFRGRGAGYRTKPGPYTSFRERACFWTTNVTNNSGQGRILFYNTGTLGALGGSKNVGHSIRCVKD